MDKIYRLKGIANDKLEHLGHAVGKYRREFKIEPNSKEVVKILKNSCVRCGAPVIIVDRPEFTEIYNEEISGPAVEIFCKKGAVKIETFATKNVFAPNTKQEWEERNKERLEMMNRKYQI